MVLLRQVKAPESHSYGVSPPVHWLSDTTAFQTDHRNERISPHFTKCIVKVTGEDKTLKQKQALETVWLIPSPSLTIFKISDWQALNSIFKIAKFHKHKFMTAICSGSLQLPEGLSRMDETEGQAHSWDPTQGRSPRNRTKCWAKIQTLRLDTSTYPCQTHLLCVESQTHKGCPPSLRSLQSNCTAYVQRHEGIH